MEISALVELCRKSLQQEERNGFYLTEEDFINKVLDALTRSNEKYLFDSLSDDFKERLIRRQRLTETSPVPSQEEVGNFCDELRKTAKLFESVDPSQLLTKILPDHEVFSAAFPLSFSGVDVFGHAVLYLKVSEVDFETLSKIPPEETLKLFCQWFEAEKALMSIIAKHLNNKRTKFVLLLDLDGLSLSSNYLTRLTELFLPLLEAFGALYSCDFWRLVFANVPEKYLQVLDAVKPWLLGKFSSFVSMFSKNNKNMLQLLTYFGIPLSSLPKEVGGTAKCESWGDITKEAINNPQELEGLIDFKQVTNVVPTGFNERATEISESWNKYPKLIQCDAQMKLKAEDNWQNVHFVLLNSVLLVFSKDPNTQGSKLIKAIERPAVSQLTTKIFVFDFPLCVLNKSFEDNEFSLNCSYSEYFFKASSDSFHGLIKSLCDFISCSFHHWCDDDDETDPETINIFFAALVNWPVSSNKTQKRQFWVSATNIYIFKPTESIATAIRMRLADVSNCTYFVGGVKYRYNGVYYTVAPWGTNTDIPNYLFCCISPWKLCSDSVQRRGCLKMQNITGTYDYYFFGLENGEIFWRLLQNPPQTPVKRAPASVENIVKFNSGNTFMLYPIEITPSSLTCICPLPSETNSWVEDLTLSWGGMSFLENETQEKNVLKEKTSKEKKGPKSSETNVTVDFTVEAEDGQKPVFQLIRDLANIIVNLATTLKIIAGNNNIMELLE